MDPSIHLEIVFVCVGGPQPIHLGRVGRPERESKIRNSLISLKFGIGRLLL